MPAPHGLLGRIQRSKKDDPDRFGPNTAAVESFIDATSRLTPAQWRQVLAARRQVASVTKEDARRDVESVRSLQAAIRGGGESIRGPMAAAGEVLFGVLAKKSEEKQVAAWEAMTALVSRGQVPALKFAVHYAPFAALVPVAGSDKLDSATRRFLAALEELDKDRCGALARRWRLEAEASRALLKAVAMHRDARSEEAAALAALMVIPKHLGGDSGWSAVRTAVHGGRVLGCAADLSREELAELWVPLDAAIPLASLSVERHGSAGTRVKPVGSAPIRTVRAPKGHLPASQPATPAGPYGSNSAEVAAFIKGVAELTPIQWLRVLDRRGLVASITRDSSDEPARVVRSILTAIEGTRQLDVADRCRAFAAVERAGYAVESQGRMSPEQAGEMFAPFAGFISAEELNGAGFAAGLAALDRSEWANLAAGAPLANEAAIAPLVNAGSALIDFLGRRSDDEAVAAWHAVSALVRRHQLTPIKFAASYAPYASAIPVNRPRSLGAMVSRYVTAVGRLGANQCALLARPWQVDEHASSALSRATVDGSARPAEEAAALAAVVTVPMRVTGSEGWAAVKTAAFGGRVIAARTRLTPPQLVALWKPISPAIPIESLSAPARARR